MGDAQHELWIPFGRCTSIYSIDLVVRNWLQALLNYSIRPHTGSTRNRSKRSWFSASTYLRLISNLQPKSEAWVQCIWKTLGNSNDRKRNMQDTLAGIQHSPNRICSGKCMNSTSKSSLPNSKDKKTFNIFPNWGLYDEVKAYRHQAIDWEEQSVNKTRIGVTFVPDIFC